ncbi:MAG TPA: hypothetical protein VGH44_06385 [Candidatus Saccharimonadia bacterium]|jgi:hypothetical protein
MVCPNCHSDDIIEVQGQHFCINCGQAVPAPASGVAGVQASGLPEGVKILSASGIPAATTATAIVTAAVDTKQATKPASRDKPVKAPEPTMDPKPTKTAEPDADSGTHPLIFKSRGRIKPVVEAEGETDIAKSDNSKPEIITDTTRTKHRKPGRPKSGPLDAPRRSINMTAPALPDAPQLGSPKAPSPVPAPVPTPTTPAPPADIPLPGPRRMSDIAPRKPRPVTIKPDTEEPELAKSKPVHKPKHKRKPLFTWPKSAPKRHHVHKVGVPALHFGPAMKFSLQARARPRHLGLAGLASVAFAAVVSYGTWLFLTLGPNGLANRLQHPEPFLVAQLTGLALLYYLGRSVGQAAITYGVAREADHRPVSLSKQLGVGINTFGRRLALDSLYACIQLALLAVVGLLIATGGQTWPVNIQLQIGALFVAFLLLLYLLTAMAITHGLAGVAITLTANGPKSAIKLGWRLFSHRFELLGLRFLAAAIELLMALPLAVLAVAFVAAAPAGLHLAVTLGVAVVAWLAGALFGAGTAAWWVALYRQLVLADHTDGAVNLLSGRQPAEAKRAPLALLVSLTTILVVAVLALPWIKL